MSSSNVSFLGLGIMGRGMALNILNAGFELTVWNRTQVKAEELIDAGATAAASIGAAVADADVILICVSDTPDVQVLMNGDEGIMAHAKKGTVIVDCSTISPSAAKELFAACREKSLGFVDAPVSGGSEGAAKGTLSIMVGGLEEDVERARPVLEAMGSTITHVGDAGAGQLTKMVNQVLVAGSMLSMAEALALAKAGGLDGEKVLQAVSGGAAGSWTLSNRGHQVLADDWRPGFTIDLQQKDLRLVKEAADELSVPVFAVDAAFQLYRSLQKQGLGSEGNHAIYKAVAKLAGL